MEAAGREPAAPPRTVWVAAIPALFAIAVYLPGALRNRWVFDDHRFIVNNPHVTNPDSWLRFLHDPVTVDPDSPTGIVRPLRTLEFALDNALFGLDATAFHLHSLLWHAVAATLAFLLFRTLLEDTMAALFGAVLWAVHPVQVESVAWISSRGDVAMGACILGSLLLALRSRGWDRWLAGSLAVGALAMLYKETAIILPLLVFAVRLAQPVRGDPGRVVAAGKAAAPWLAVAVAYFRYRSTVMIGDFAHTDAFVMGGSTAGTFATMFRGFGVYVTTFFVPATQAHDWYMPVSTSLFEAGALLWIGLHGAAICAAIALRTRAPLFSAGVCIFYLALIPVANWPFALGIPTAERFLYVPSIGLALLVADGLRRTRARGLPVRPAASCALICLAMLSFFREGVWHDDDSFWRAEMAAHQTPRGSGIFSENRLREAKAVRRGPSTPNGRERFRELLTESLGHAHDAIDQWHRFERVTFSKSYVVLQPENNAANACFLLGEHGHGLWHADEAIRIAEVSVLGEGKAPGQPSYNRALMLLKLRRGPSALRAIEQALDLGMAIRPAERSRMFSRAAELCQKEGFHALALVAAQKGLEPGQMDRLRSESAAMLTGTREAAEADPKSWLAAGAYARALASTGSLAEADRRVSEWNEGLRKSLGDDVEWIQARHESLGTREGWEEALRCYRELEPEGGDPLYRMARCEEALGRREAALESYREAVYQASQDGVRMRSWRDDAERAAQRLETGCPVRRDHGLPE